MEITGHDPDTYYMIGTEHRIPEPTPEVRNECVQGLLGASFSQKRRSRVGNAGRAARRTPQTETATVETARNN